MANEQRLIDVNALIEHLTNCKNQEKGIFGSVCVAIKCFVEQMPTVDAVEVVRCKECEYAACNPVKLTYSCRHPNGLRGLFNEGYFFCPHGERRVDGK